MDFKNGLTKLGIELKQNQEEQFLKYYHLLIAWNEKINLTGITNIDEVYLKHFYDSLTLVKAYQFSNERICDIGSGAGFPSIPLKIIYPNLNVTIIDSLNKRIGFLEELVKELHLENVHLKAIRAEDDKDYYDIVTSRALANYSIGLELCLPRVKVNGYYLPLLGKKGETKEDVIMKLGGVLEQVINFSLPLEQSERTIFVIKKQKETDKRYPRKFALIKNKPL